MNQSHFHTKNIFSPTPPPQFGLSIIQKLVAIYKLWHEFLPHFPRDSRQTLGQKIDDLFLEVIENVVKAGYSDKAEKEIFLKRASVKLDLLKFFLQVAWEIKSVDNKKYISLSEKLNEVGKMLGGWLRSIK